MKDYELLYIVSGGLTEADATKVTDEVGSALLKLGGKADEENVWGRRGLAYPIGKDDHGWYVVTRFSMDPAKLDEFGKALNLNGKILRTVLLKADEVPSPEEAKKAQDAAEQADKEAAEARSAAKKSPGVSAKASKTATEIPETVKRAAPKPAAAGSGDGSDAAEAGEPKERKEKPVDETERKQQLDEKLGEILKD